MKNRARIWIFSLLLLFSVIIAIAGCTIAPLAAFINGTGQRITLSLYDDRTGRIQEVFTLEPDTLVKKRLFSSAAEVKNEKGDRLFEQKMPRGGNYVWEEAERNRTIYLLVTEEGFFLVPYQYKDHWKEHLPEILESERGPAFQPFGKPLPQTN